MAVPGLVGFTTNPSRGILPRTTGDAHPNADRPTTEEPSSRTGTCRAPSGGPPTRPRIVSSRSTSPRPAVTDAPPPPPHACHRRPPLPPSPCPMHGVPAERRQDDCPIANKGAQRASARKLRSALTGVFAALVIVTAMSATAPPAQAASQKVVIVVGPVGSATADYKHGARKLADKARSLRRQRGGDLQPVRDVVTRPRRRPGREHPDLPRPRQRLAQPVSPVHGHVEGRHGPQRQLGPRQLEHEVLRRVLHGAAGPRVARRGRAQPAVLRLGQQRVGRRQPDPQDRQEAGRQLRVRVHQGRCPGRVRQRHHRRRLRPQGPVHGLEGDVDVGPVLDRPDPDRPTTRSASTRGGSTGSRRAWTRTRRTATTDPSSDGSARRWGTGGAADRQRPWRNHATAPVSVPAPSRFRWVRLRRAAIRRARRRRSAPRPARRGTGTRPRPPRAAPPRRRPRTPRGSR